MAHLGCIIVIRWGMVSVKPFTAAQTQTTHSWDWIYKGNTVNCYDIVFNNGSQDVLKHVQVFFVCQFLRFVMIWWAVA